MSGSVTHLFFKELPLRPFLSLPCGFTRSDLRVVLLVFNIFFLSYNYNRNGHLVGSGGQKLSAPCTFLFILCGFVRAHHFVVHLLLSWSRCLFRRGQSLFVSSDESLFVSSWTVVVRFIVNESLLFVNLSLIFVFVSLLDELFRYCSFIVSLLCIVEVGKLIHSRMGAQYFGKRSFGDSSPVFHSLSPSELVVCL